MMNYYIHNYETFKNNITCLSFSENSLCRFRSILKSKNRCIACIGSGASFTVAMYAAHAMNKAAGIAAFPFSPGDFANYRHDCFDCILAFSYSGNFRELPPSSVPTEKFSVISSEAQYNITADKWPGQRGFNLPESVLLFCIFVNYALEIVDMDVLCRMDHWERALRYSIRKFSGNIVIFGGNNSICAAKELQTKLEESGICLCKLYNKREFAHGKFCEYEKIHPAVTLFLKQKSTSTYERILTNYLSETGKSSLLILESVYDGVLAEIDLLIAVNSLLYDVSWISGTDFADPSFSPKALTLFQCDHTI